MLKYKKIKVGKKIVEAIAMPFQTKTLVVLRGSKGYIMCGYLNLEVAAKFNDAAAMITGVVSIEDALKAKVYALTPAAQKLGIYTAQPIKDVLKLIA